MTKKDLLYLFWIFIRCGFLIYLSCVFLGLGVLIPAIFIFILIFIDLGVEFLKMVENSND
jgi:hypothetical protein